jgi:hypothetical protein
MTAPARAPRARQAEPSHAVIIERIEALGALMDIRFDGLEGRVQRIEAHLDRQDTVTAADNDPPKWIPYAIGAGVVLSLLAGAGLSIIAITQLDLFGPLLDAAERVHGAAQ